MKREYIIYKLSESIKSTSHIEADLFVKYNVKRGLRNLALEKHVIIKQQ